MLVMYTHPHELDPQSPVRTDSSKTNGYFIALLMAIIAFFFWVLSHKYFIHFEII